MARFMVKASEYKNVCKAVNDRKLAELKKEIIEILKKQDEKEFKKAVDLFESQEMHYTHLEKSITGKWVEKAGYGVGTVRIWKGKKYKKIAPGKWARVFDKEGRGTNIAIGKLIAKVNKIDNAEDLLQFVLENKQRFVDENGKELDILDKVRAAVDTRQETLSGESNKYTYGLDESVNRAKDKLFEGKDKINAKEADLHKVSRKLSQVPTTELKQRKAKLDRWIENKTRNKRDSINNAIFRDSYKQEVELINKELEKRNGKKADKKPEKNSGETYDDGYKVISEDETFKKKLKNGEMTLESLKEVHKQGVENGHETQEYADGVIQAAKDILKENKTDSKEDKIASYKKQLEDVVKEELVNQKEDIERLYKIKEHGLSGKYAEGLKLTEKDKNTSIEDRIQEAAEWLVEHPTGNPKSIGKMLARVELAKEFEKDPDWRFGKKEESEAEKGNYNKRKFGADWEEKRKEIQGKLTENTDKLLEDNDNAKDTYEKLQNQLNKRKADAELYRKYLGNQEEPEDVKDFRKWCDDVIEQYRKEVTNTPSKEIISKWEETARNTPTEKLEEVYNGKQKVDYSNEYENFIDSTIINEFAKDKDLVFPQPYTMLKDIATRKFDNSDKIRLEVIKKELEKRNKGNAEETSESSNKKYKSTPSFKPVKSVNVKKSAIAETTKIADGKVSLPGTKEVKNEIKQLISCLLKDKTEGTYRDVMKHVYYDGENMIATDGKQLKVINVGEMDGIEPNKYLSIDTKGKDIIIEQDEKDYGRYPAYKRVMPDNNNMQIRFDNNVLKEKIEEMKKDGSIDMEAKRISLKVQDGNVYLDNVRVGSADGVKFEDDRQFIDFNYKLLTNALSGDESIMAVSDNPDKVVTISTSVSDNIFMPLKTDHNEVDYESNRKAKAATDENLEKKRAQDAADKEDRQKRSITDAAKSEILKDKPEGVTDNDYEDLIDYCNDFYAKLGYDNSTEKGKRDIKRTIDNAINKINGKDFEILEMIENPDNKVSRKVFETITAMKLGSNRESAKEAWSKWVGKEAMQKHNDEIAAQKQAEKDRIAAEKKAADDADREQYHGFLDGKTAAGKGKAKQILAKRARFDNKVYSYQELVDHYINELGGRVSSSVHTTSGGKDKTYYGVYDKEGRGYEIPKIVFDYGKHIQGDNGVEKSFVKDFFFLNEYEHDLLDEEDLEEDESLFNDYSAEQPELFNSTEMKVQEAFNRCGCCL